MGVEVAPRTQLFEEVVPGRWFIPNCVDTDLFSPRAGLHALGKLNPILVPRNLTRSRGVDLAIRAFALFVPRHPETNLVIVGDIIYDNLGEFRYKQELNQLVEKLGLVGRVYFLGQVSRERMPSIYSSAAMTVIPTRRSEGTSLAALESMACGVATVATAVEGLLDLPAMHCLAEPTAMAAEMERVFRQRKRIGQIQQEIVRQVYNLENWEAAWLAVLESRGQSAHRD